MYMTQNQALPFCGGKKNTPGNEVARFDTILYHFRKIIIPGDRP